MKNIKPFLPGNMILKSEKSKQMFKSKYKDSDWLMKTLFLALMLISPFSLANLGDTYYCSTTMNFSVNHNGRSEPTLKKKNFKFNLDEKSEFLTFQKNHPLEIYH